MRKDKLIIILCLILLLIIIILINKKTKEKKVENNQTNQGNIITEKVSYDDNSGLYYVRNPETNEIIAVSHDESNLEFYKDNPDYNPNPEIQRSTSIEDFMYQDEIEEDNLY